MVYDLGITFDTGSKSAENQTVAAMPISGCYAQYVCLPVNLAPENWTA